MAINRCLSTNNTASNFAYVIPKLLLTPCAAALIWVQIAQLTQIRFSLMAPISVGLFSTIFLIVFFGMVRKSFLRSFVEDLSWLPLATSCLIFALLGFVLVRWDADDTHYLSNAIYLLSHPDTNMGFEAYYIYVEGTPFQAISWINSYAIEYLIASFAHVLKVDFLSINWTGKTILAAYLIPCAWYTLLSQFELRHDSILVAICSTLFVVLIMGDTFNSYGNWFITRLFQGKVIVVALGLPLIWSYVISYLKSPNIHDWAGMLVISSAMIGFSTMAGFLLPVTVLTLVLAYCLTNRIKIWFDIKRSFGLLSAFTYLIAVAVYIRLNVNPIILQNDSVMNRHYPTNFFGQMSFITDLSFPLSLTIIVVTSLASIKILSGSNRNLVAWWCGIYVGFFLTPFTAHFLMENLTTSNIYWRLFHGYPIPLVIGLTAAGIYNMIVEQTIFRKIIVLFISSLALGLPHAILVMQIAFGSDRTAPSVIRAIHRVSAGGPRVSDIRLSDVHAVLPHLPHGPVLAAHPINSDIPIFSGNHPLIYARMIETEFWFQTRGNPQKGERRRFAMKFASGLSPANEESFFQVINEEPAIRSLVLKPEALKSARVLERIITNGFNDIGKMGRYRVFIRKHI